MTAKLYKIRRKGTTDQFSTGGSCPKWSNKGKIWSAIGHVKSHLRQYGQSTGYRDPVQYDGAEIVTFSMTEEHAEDVQCVLDEMAAQKKSKEARSREAERKRKAEQEQAELRRLRKKYPDV